MDKILITGANGNLGSEIVSHFIRHNYLVIALNSPGKSLDQHSSSLEQYNQDLYDEAGTTAVLEKITNKHPDLSRAIHTVGGFAMGNLENTTFEQVRHMIDLNFGTTYNLVRPLFNYFKKQGKGRIILTGAKPALEPEAGKTTLAYSLSKSLLFQLTELMNAEGAASNVFTTVVVPSIIDTRPNRNAMPNANFEDWVKPSQLAEAMYWLLSEQASAVREPVFRVYNKS